MTASVAPGPGLGAQQHTSWRSRNRYRPYERRESSGNTPAGQLPSQNSLGDNLDKATDQGVMVGVGVQPLVSQSRSSTPNINDNYCTSPTVKTQNVSQSDQFSQLQTVNCLKVHHAHRQLYRSPKQTVSCPVVCHVHFTGIRGPPQKKNV